MQATKEELTAQQEKYPSLSKWYNENIVLFRNLANQICKDGVALFHGVLLAYRGNGYLFCGKSGQGKSTHASLWEKYFSGVEIINGDKPFLTKKQGKIVAHGTPWNGKEGKGKNKKLPVKALLYIEQAKQNQIEKIDDTQKSKFILQQLYMPNSKQGIDEAFNFANELISLPMYLLKCDISKEAATLSFKALTGEEE